MTNADFWAIFWFVLGTAFFIAAMCVIQKPDDSYINMLCLAMVCHARSEIAIVRKKIEKKGV